MTANVGVGIITHFHYLSYKYFSYTINCLDIKLFSLILKGIHLYLHNLSKVWGQ